ncbi:MAG TPA: SufD family Fe-S cluster assembly protein [Candidatus Limnocylindria bacterium]|nr:SufD family Fe-S cluster assembly protein [Candidatus Limnocylindria bacterium]
MTLATATRIPLPLDRATVERLSVSRGEPGWLRDSRLAALERYASTEWPTGHEEEWRRFPLRDLPAADLARIVDTKHPPSEYGSVPLAASRHGLVFDRMLNVAREHPDLVRRWLPAGEGIASHRAFRALADASFAHGSGFLYVPAGLDVELPLEVHKRWSAGTEPIVFRTIVVVEANASVTLVEELSSELGGPRVAVPSLEVHAGPGARVRYVGIHRFAEDVWEIGQQNFISARDSVVASFNVVVGSARTKLGVRSDIRGDGAEVKLYGLVAAHDRQRIDVNTFQRLDGKGSSSDSLYLSALYDEAKAVNYGVIRVEPTSSGTGSYQECRNMLLSDKAGADPIPVLEILTNDVARCGHGATAGALEEDELFYVMSRGLDRVEAESMLVRGFFQRVLSAIPEPQVRARVLAALAPRIGRVAELDAVAA